MSTTSRIPTTIDALVTFAQTSLPAITVQDGPPLDWGNIKLPSGSANESQMLFIGADPDDDIGAVGQQDFNAAGAVSRDERFLITCTAWAWAGSVDIKGRRDEAFAIVAAVEQLIRSNVSLGGAVLYSRMAGVSRYSPRQQSTGAAVVVVFAVEARAYLT